MPGKSIWDTVNINDTALKQKKQKQKQMFSKKYQQTIVEGAQQREKIIS